MGGSFGQARDRKQKHVYVFNTNFCHPTQKPHFGPSEVSLCASFPRKQRTKGTYIMINSVRGDFGGQKGGPKRARQFGSQKNKFNFSLLPLTSGSFSPYGHWLKGNSNSKTWRAVLKMFVSKLEARRKAEFRTILWILCFKLILFPSKLPDFGAFRPT